MISAAELARLKELCEKPHLASNAHELLAAVPPLLADLEMLQHENSTCAAALMIARDARHAAEHSGTAAKETLKECMADCLMANTKLEAAEAELALLHKRTEAAEDTAEHWMSTAAALRAELEGRK